jgi:hypothetical protein
MHFACKSEEKFQKSKTNNNKKGCIPYGMPAFYDFIT